MTPHSTGSLITSPEGYPDRTVDPDDLRSEPLGPSVSPEPSPPRSDPDSAGQQRRLQLAWECRGPRARADSRHHQQLLQGRALDAQQRFARSGSSTNIPRATLRRTSLWETWPIPSQLDPGADQRTFVKYQAGGPPAESVFRSQPFAAPGGARRCPACGPRRTSWSWTRSAASAAVDCEGRWRPARDALDERIIGHVRSGSGPATDDQLDHPNDLGGVPTLVAGAPCQDSDLDGMPGRF